MHSENSYLRALQIKLDTLQENINSKVDICEYKVEEQELSKLVNSLKEDVSSLYEYSVSTSSDKDWPFGLIYNIIAKVAYLKSNLNSLTNEEIKNLKNSLDDLLNIYDTELFGPQVCIAIIGFGMTFLGVLFSALFSTWWIAIILFLITPLFLKFAVYPKLKEDIRGEAFKKLGENIEDIKKLNKELAKMLKEQKTNEVEIAKVNQPKEVKKLETSKEYTLVTLINDTKRNIMMLSNNDETEFNNRLALALNEFKTSLTSSKNMSGNMKKDMEYYASTKLTKDLKSINEDVLKLYQENKLKMKDETLNKFINDYMNNIDVSKDKITEFIKLKDNLKTLIDNEDILSKMEIKERLADCFYYTIKDFNKNELTTILNFIEEDLFDALTLVGEKILNEREDNLEITSYYNRIKELKPKFMIIY